MKTKTLSQSRSKSPVLSRLLLGILRLSFVFGVYMALVLGVDRGVFGYEGLIGMGGILFSMAIPGILDVHEVVEFYGWGTALRRNVVVLCAFVFKPLRLAVWATVLSSLWLSPWLTLLALVFAVAGETYLRVTR